MKYIILFIALLTVSCGSQSEGEKAEYWRARYMALRSFVENAGLGPAADSSLRRSVVAATVYVRADTYHVNKIRVTSDEALAKALKSIKLKDNEAVDIVISRDASHEQLLKVLDKLNRNGLKNFNLIRE